MKLLLDVNVVLDVLLLRQPHLEASAKVLDACERHKAQGCLCATSLTTLYYLGIPGFVWVKKRLGEMATGVNIVGNEPFKRTTQSLRPAAGG